MHPSNGRGSSPTRGERSFTDGFLGAMDDELDSAEEEEFELPDIEEEILDPGRYQHVVLEEASIDEALPTMEKVYLPQESEWEDASPDFRGYGESSEAIAARREDHPSLSGEDLFGGSGMDDDDTLAMLGSLTGGEDVEPEVDPDSVRSFYSSPEEVDTDSAFDEVEDQYDDGEDIDSILANIPGMGPSDESSPNDREDEDDSSHTIPTNFKLSEEDEELLQGFDIDKIISFAIDSKASDIHIVPNQRVRYRINGTIIPVTRFESISGEITSRIEQKIVTHVAQDFFLKEWELDTSYTVRTGPHRGRRVRVNVSKRMDEIAMVMRVISQSIPLPHELEIERELLEWAELSSGLVLMNGPTGTGKSTTLASIIQTIQLNRACSIITVEKPVEYMYKDQGKAVLYQREVGRDTKSFAGALDSAMRMDPDVILIGETRNATEMGALLYAADTGHLALSTTHARSSAEVITRVKRMFPEVEHSDILQSLATHAHGFASQKLCKTADGKGRFAVREILTISDDEAIKDLILQGNDRGIRRLQEARGTTIDHALLRAVQSGRANWEDARMLSDNRKYLDALRADAPRPL